VTDTQFDQAMKTAIRLQEIRDTLRRLWGDQYTERCAPWRELIRKGASNARCSPLQVPMLMQANARAKGDEIGEMSILWLTAAACDEAEEKGAIRDVQARI
jgi:hypothetical protein